MGNRTFGTERHVVGKGRNTFALFNLNHLKEPFEMTRMYEKSV